MIDLHAHFVPRSALEAVAGARGLPAYDPDSRTVSLPSGPSRPVSPALSDLGDRRRWMAERGIATQVLSPWTDLQGDDLDPDAALRWVRLMNDAASDEVHGADGFRLLAMLPGDGQEAARELERCMALPGFAGGALPTQFAGSDLDVVGFDDLFATAVRLDVPILLHPGRVMASERMSRWFLNNVCGYPFETTLAALRLFFAGTFDRHPELRVLLSHGGGTLPMLAGRAAHTVGRVPAVPGDAAAPGDLLGCFFYDSVVHDPMALAFTVRRVGVERMVAGTDAPFPMAVEDPRHHLRDAAAEAGVQDPVARLDETATRLLPQP